MSARSRSSWRRRSTPTSATRRRAGRPRRSPGAATTARNAYEEGKAEAFPSSLREAVDEWEKSDFAKGAFGESVHRHYLNYGRLEQKLFDQVVTDYERTRMFERG
jgi:glutamine synthetase